MAFVLIYYLLYCYTVGKFYVFWNYWPDLLIIYFKLQIKNVSFLGYICFLSGLAQLLVVSYCCCVSFPRLQRYEVDQGFRGAEVKGLKLYLLLLSRVQYYIITCWWNRIRCNFRKVPPIWKTNSESLSPLLALSHLFLCCLPIGPANGNKSLSQITISSHGLDSYIQSFFSPIPFSPFLQRQ